MKDRARIEVATITKGSPVYRFWTDDFDDDVLYFGPRTSRNPETEIERFSGIATFKKQDIIDFVKQLKETNYA